MKLSILFGAYLLLNGYVLIRTALFLRRNLPGAGGTAAAWSGCLVCALERLRVVLIADTHLGYSVGRKRIEDMVALVNAQDVDLIAFAGDIFDNSASTMDDPAAVKLALSGMRSRLGVYACWGNHDVDECLFSGLATVPDAQALRGPAMGEFLRECGIIMLEDEAVLPDGAFYLVGRMDHSNIGDGTQNRASIDSLLHGLDAAKPILVIDHEPRALQASTDAGVDLLLSGHTHDGQFFPLNLSTRLAWENPSGMLHKGNITSVVTCGVGVYGPDMRVCTDADISMVDITFAAE